MACHMSRVGQNCIYTVYDRIFGDFPAKNAVYTPYTVYIWFWPTLHMSLVAIDYNSTSEAIVMSDGPYALVAE